MCFSSPKLAIPPSPADPPDAPEPAAKNPLSGSERRAREKAGKGKGSGLTIPPPINLPTSSPLNLA